MAGGECATLTYVGGLDNGGYTSPSQVVEYAGSRYVFNLNSSSDLVYRKSTDRGRSWAAPVLIHSASLVRISIWFDRWTPGNSGTIVHIWDIDTTTDDVFYFSLALSTDTLGNAGVGVTVFNGVSATTDTQLSGAKSRGGNLLVAFNIDGGTELGTYRSTDAGATWGARADANEVAIDFYLMFPGNAADNQDMELVYWDVSANEISLKSYDDSANSWSETSISTGMTSVAQTTSYSQMAGAVRASDGHILLAAWSQPDNAASDLRAWDINGSGSITAKTDVVTNSDDCVLALVSISPTGTVFCTYAGKSGGSETAYTALGIYQKASTDGMASWGTERAVYTNRIGWVPVLMGAQQVESSWPLVCWLDISLVASGLVFLHAAYTVAPVHSQSQIGV
jgi:hypothetical protein